MHERRRRPNTNLDHWKYDFSATDAMDGGHLEFDEIDDKVERGMSITGGIVGASAT